MIRIPEALAVASVMAPASVSASTDTTTEYLDAAGAAQVAFLITAAPLGAGKSLTVTLMAAEDDEGTNAQELGTATFTDAGGTAPQTAVVSYEVSALNGRYLAVKFQHDAAAAVICSAVALADQIYRPAGGWTLVV